MKLIKTKIKDLLIIKTNIYNDNRGFFKEIEKLKLLKKKFMITQKTGLMKENIIIMKN